MQTEQLKLWITLSVLLVVTACASSPNGPMVSANSGRPTTTAEQNGATPPSTGGQRDRYDFSAVKAATLTLKAFDSDMNPIRQGSGFYIGSGLVVTNAHVVKGAAFVEMYNDHGDRVGNAPYALYINQDLDLAILPAPDLPVPALSGHTGQVTAGTPVWVVGSPMGFADTLSRGIISAIRTIGDQRFLQISASVSPGSSGGPVVNADGKVLGVVVAHVREQGAQNLNFAIPFQFIGNALGGTLARQPFPELNSTSSAAKRFAKQIALKMLTAPPVSIGDTYQKVLEPKSAGELAAAAYFKLYIDEGQPIDITVRSDSFDPAIALFSKESFRTDNPWMAEDDDSGLGDSAELDGSVPSSGVYFLIVKSENRQTGLFRLDLSRIRQEEPSPEDDRWVYIFRTDNAKTYIDQEHIASRDGYIFAWTKAVFDGVESFGDDLVHALFTQYAIDCSNYRYKLVFAIGRRNNDIVFSIERELYETDWSRIVPGSVTNAVFNVVCSR